MIRLATEKDSGKILDIYSPYITSSTATCEITPPSKDEFRERIKSIMPQYPFLVYEQNGDIVGYAYSAKYRERAAYLYTVSASVYLLPENQSNGIGSELYSCMLRILKAQGYFTCTAGIVMPNEKSYNLHTKLGFKEIGILHNVGYKFGKWLDIMWLEKSINDYNIAPGVIKPITEIDLEPLLYLPTDLQL